MTDLELLKDTVKYYSKDVSRRCVQNKNCTYSPQEAGQTGCAIGRHLPEDVQQKLDIRGNAIIAVLTTQDLRKLLPEWMLKINNKVLQDIQQLHDYEKYWDANGLSEEGREEVKRIKLFIKTNQ